MTWDNPSDWNVDHADLVYTADGGENWVEIASGVTSNSFAWTTPELSSDQVKVRVFVFDGQGMLGFDSSDEFFTLSSGITPVEPNRPMVYALAQNFPNPFNPQTEIRFELKSGGNTRMRVYDIRGRLVKDLVSGHLEAGPHSIVWMGRDNGGRQVASGVYYYKIDSGKFSETKRMTLVK